MNKLLGIILISLLSSTTWGAKVLQGDGMNGATTSENFVKQGDAEVDFRNVRLYNNGDVAAPTTCSGGTSSGVTIARTAKTVSEGMTGNYFWKITKTAGSKRGQGIAFDFTVSDFVSKNQIVLSAGLKLSEFVGTFKFGELSDIGIYIYDRDKSQMMILGGGNDILGNISDSRVFNVAKDSKNFTLCLHVQTTNASAYSVGVDDVKVREAGPESRGDVNNTFTARFNPGGVYISRTGPYEDWITCTKSSTGTYICPTKGFTSTPNCTSSTGNSYMASADVVFNAAFVATVRTGTASSYGDMPFTLSCTRTGSDYIKDAVMADQYTGMDIYFEGRKSSDQAMTANVTKLTLTASKDTTGSWSGDSYKVPSTGYYLITAGFNTANAPASTQIYINGVSANIRVNSMHAQLIFNIGASAIFLEKDSVLDFRSSSSVTYQGGAQSVVTIYKLNSSQALFRPDTFYPADVDTNEFQVGWDRTVTPIKPIYKRCHIVATDVKTSGATLATWAPNLKPKDTLKYSATSWALKNIVGTTTTSNVNIVYVEGTGAIAVGIAGTFFLGAGTEICMKYTKP